MPRKSDVIPINNRELDRRIKLSDKERQEIFENIFGLSQRQLAKKYNVSRKLIQYILYPEKAEAARQNAIKNKVWLKYYDKEKNTRAIREHRDYKKELYNKKLIGNG